MPGTDHVSSKSQRVSLFKAGKHCISFANTISIIIYILCCVSVYVAECPPLGMESHKIESDQLSASSMSQYSFAPQRARLNMQVHTNPSGSARLNTLQLSLTYSQALT